ncbi:hypothetical protein COT75_02500 [Candidatus Beckwithbacteria bacterium CG10_big_fil_rev_8_21_14_0_10_34_10]|uniref:DUF3795 domain-containing protein n=1 Tax=Candidatus Beckwithbacteria bacterium CG10_big_fil_rev_8_21_14_0_10_34_10 TaxID=1974495 RepID=A0A2H0WBG6_9BACT|nr:MAG: hypothetical protein COT75_02500 [Candidatus Beckwithbacteria bacterium CG10_big_fil_rev_8_21_14_0_10_34_10]
MGYFGFCGLDCSCCDAYIATKNNDDKLREKTAKDWTKRYKKDKKDRLPIKPDEINCQGCLSAGPIYHYCHQCQIRKCGIKKGIKNCQECQDYKCDQLIDLQKHFF